MTTQAITLDVDDEEYQLTVPANRTLLQVLRYDLGRVAPGLTGTKYGCGTGECGACTVLDENNTSILACLTLAVLMDGKKISTCAGLEKDGELHPVQQAFVDNHAIQCGYCTPGMVMKAVSMLDRNPNITEEEIRHELEGNICRCTGYVKIVEAIEQARDEMNVQAGRQ
jgi:carbon-monoxide dehydrogenase small subunit